MLDLRQFDSLGAALRAALDRWPDEVCLIEADRERCESLVEQSLAMCTPLAPVIGYDKAAEIAKKAYKEGKTVREVAREVSGLSEQQLNKIFNLHALTEPGIRGKGGE